MDAKEKKKRRAKEDKSIDRVLVWFGGAVILEFFVLLLNRFYINFSASEINVAHGIARFLVVLLMVCAVLAVAGFVWVLLLRKKGKRLFWPVVGTVACAVLALCSAVAILWSQVGVQFLYIMVPVVAVLVLIYYLYQREFFLLAVLGGLGLFAMWSFRKLVAAQPAAVYVIFALAAVVTVVFAVGFVLMSRNKGRLPGKRKVKVLGAKTSYVLLYIACAINAAAMLAVALTSWLGGMDAGYTTAYVALIVEVVWLFGAAIYYTVRLL